MLVENHLVASFSWMWVHKGRKNKNTMFAQWTYCVKGGWIDWERALSPPTTLFIRATLSLLILVGHFDPRLRCDWSDLLLVLLGDKRMVLENLWHLSAIYTCCASFGLQHPALLRRNNSYCWLVYFTEFEGMERQKANCLDDCLFYRFEVLIFYWWLVVVFEITI